YQEDESYVEYCFTKEPSPGYFKATCLYDPIDPAMPRKIEALVKRNPGRIVDMRIHDVHERGTPVVDFRRDQESRSEGSRPQTVVPETGTARADGPGAVDSVLRQGAWGTGSGLSQCPHFDRSLRPGRPRNA